MSQGRVHEANPSRVCEANPSMDAKTTLVLYPEAFYQVLGICKFLFFPKLSLSFNGFWMVLGERHHVSKVQGDSYQMTNLIVYVRKKSEEMDPKNRKQKFNYYRIVLTNSVLPCVCIKNHEITVKFRVFNSRLTTVDECLVFL